MTTDAVVIRDRIRELRRVPASELIPNPKNWRTHPKAQADAMRAVLQEIGYADGLLARETPEGLVLLNGHLRAETTPDSVVPVLILDVTEAEADKLLATFDPIGTMAGADKALLGGLLASVETDSLDVAALLESVARQNRVPIPGAGGLTEPDAVPPLPDAPTSQPGDLWQLGPHRLLCGDATDPEAAARLLAGAQASMLWTDPPYGVSYTGGTKDKLQIQNDDAAGLHALLLGAFSVADQHLAAGAPFYIAHPAGPLGLVFGDVLREVGWGLRETLIWVKDSMVLGHSDYHYRHEPVFYGGVDDALPPWHGDFVEQEPTGEAVLYGWLPGAPHPWYGKRAEVSVFLIDRPKASREHPTMKPVELMERCIRNSTLPGASVLDPFLGSGSTLMAADRSGRVCYGMELDPRYVDVAVRRWEEYTGRRADRLE